MDAQDVADDELAVSRARGIDDGLRLLHRLGQRLLAEHVAARVERGRAYGACVSGYVLMLTASGFVAASA